MPNPKLIESHDTTQMANYILAAATLDWSEAKRVSRASVASKNVRVDDNSIVFDTKTPGDNYEFLINGRGRMQIVHKDGKEVTVSNVNGDAPKRLAEVFDKIKTPESAEVQKNRTQTPAEELDAALVGAELVADGVINGN